MAIQVGGTTVIDNSRNLTNVVGATLSGTLTTTKIAETAVALGNSGTAQTINLNNGTVFTCTLTGNCTFTVSNAATIATFVLVLTNDGTAGRSVSWAGGTFTFAGGSANLNRTTGISGVDIWAFTTVDGGSNWRGNIVMRDVKS
jgi:hypothetical protein